jgi:FHA domain
MNVELKCPYCGTSMQIDSSLKEFICEYCGSSLTDHLKQVKKNLPKSPINSPSGAASSNIQQNPNLMPNPRQTPAFLKSTAPQNVPKPKISIPSKGAVLEVAQINNFIQIPSSTNPYYFGRNTLIKMIDPKNYNIEWLNSISRIHKDPNSGQIIKAHFMISKVKKKYLIEDKQSSWGTWLNGKQIKGKGKFEIKKGEKIELMLSVPKNKAVLPFTLIFLT